MKKHTLRYIGCLGAMLFMVLFFQNCSSVQFLNLESIGLSEPSPKQVAGSVPASNASGNGGTYDGKLRILHHYVQDFTCEGRPQPESILVRKTETDWVVIRNKPAKCRDVDQAAVSGVTYDEATKVGAFEGKKYIPPKPYYVLATEDPNSPDAYVVDGVCENSNGKCSLLAATQTAEAVSSTDSVLIIIASGIYKLTNALGLTYRYPAHPVTFQGVSASQTILDGQNRTHHFQLGGGPPSTNFQKLSFVNGNNSAMKSSSTISLTMYTTSNYSGAIAIEDCEFSNNVNNPVLFQSVTAGGLTVKRSRFDSNSGDALSTEGNRFTIDDTSISNNGGIGINSGSAYSQLKVRNSSIYNNSGQGIMVTNCYDCFLENTTIYNNKQNGINIFSSAVSTTANFNFEIRNSTIYNNATTSGSSIRLLLEDPANHLVIKNSVISTNNPSRTNCAFNASYSHAIVATNSLFDDATCGASGVANIMTNPLLDVLNMNGGLTPTLMPLSGSPLIDSGENQVCTALDQRSVARPMDKLGAGARCDIGAVEVQ